MTWENGYKWLHKLLISCYVSSPPIDRYSPYNQGVVKSISLAVLMLFLAGAGFSRAADGWRARDGDTVVTPAGEVVRLANIDAPETGPRCRCEVECRMGEAAKAFAAATLRDSRRVELRPYPRPVDRYGRTLAYVLTDNVDLGDRLIEAGLARKWEGKRRSWCD